MENVIRFEDLQAIKSELSEIKKYSLISAKTMLTVEEVALFTGLSTGYIYQLTHSRQIPYYKPRGHVLYFNRHEIDAWMQQNRCNTQGEAEAKALSYAVEKGGRA